jgi:hypothetical protein
VCEATECHGRWNECHLFTYGATHVPRRHDETFGGVPRS